MKKLYGVTVAMVTPMLEDGSIDLEGVAKLTEMLVGKGAVRAALKKLLAEA